MAEYLPVPRATLEEMERNREQIFSPTETVAVSADGIAWRLRRQQRNMDYEMVEWWEQLPAIPQSQENDDV